MYCSTAQHAREGLHPIEAFGLARIKDLRLFLSHASAGPPALYYADLLMLPLLGDRI